MRRTLYAIAALALITAVSCNKSDEDIDNVPDKGAVQFENGTSNERYDIYLDDYKYGNLFGGGVALYPGITAGVHRVKAQQIDVTGPGNLYQKQITVVKDSVYVFRFP